MPSRLIQLFILGSMTLCVLAVIALAVVNIEPDWLPLFQFEAKEEAMVNLPEPTLVPTFTVTPSPLPPTLTPTFTSTPTPTPVPTATPEPSLTPTATPPPTQRPAPIDTVAPTRSPIDFVVVKQRMRSNEENSVLGKVANNCGGDHTIYVQVLDVGGQPLPDVIVGDTYKNVRAASGMDGPGRLKIELWSNTMSLEVQGNIDGTSYTSQPTLPLSTRDEDIPTDWLFAGGYCGSLAECQLRQKTNGLCRGHYSYDVIFQRTW